MEIIPSIGILDGTLISENTGNIVQPDEIFELASELSASGAKQLYIIDHEGIQNGSLKELDLAKSIGKKTSLKVGYQGGIRAAEDLMKVLQAGIKMVNFGVEVIAKKALFTECLRVFGAYRFLLYIKVDNEKLVFDADGQDGDLTIFDFLDEIVSSGIRNVACVEVGNDGINVGMYKKLKDRYPKLHLIAGGDAINESDLENLTDLGIEKVIVSHSRFEELTNKEAIHL